MRPRPDATPPSWLDMIDHGSVESADIRLEIVSGGERGSGQRGIGGIYMAYGVVHRFAGGTQEQYEASIAAVHPEGGGLPEGQLFHAAGPSADGWTIIAVHDPPAGGGGGARGGGSSQCTTRGRAGSGSATASSCLA